MTWCIYGIDVSTKNFAKTKYAIGLVGVVTTISTTSFAASNLPGAVEPGRIEKQFEQPPKPKSVPEIVVPEKVEQIPPAEAKKIHFALTGIELEGATVYRREDLLPLWEKLLGKEVSLGRRRFPNMGTIFGIH
jgi:hypothetical protein